MDYAEFDEIERARDDRLAEEAGEKLGGEDEEDDEEEEEGPPIVLLAFWAGSLAVLVGSLTTLQAMAP